MLNKLVEKFVKIKAQKIFMAVKNHLGDSILDVGAGRCLIAKKIAINTGKKITCLEVKDYNQTDLDLVLFDGKKIPFKDNEFDTVMINYVLHHIPWQEDIIDECIRVSKGNIIINEDSPINIFTYIWDYIFNSITGVKCVYKYRSIKGWLDLFKEKGLKVVALKRGIADAWYYPFVPHTMFVLKVKS